MCMLSECNYVSNLSPGASQSLERGTIDVFGLGAICLGGPGVVAPELMKMKEPTRTNSTHTLSLGDLTPVLVMIF